MITGGMSFPYLPEQTRHHLKTGWNAGIGVGMSFEPGDMGYGSVDLSLEFNRFAFNNNAFRNTVPLPNIGVTRNPTTTMSFTLSFKGTFSSTKKSIAPFFLVGVGMTRLSVGDIGVIGDTTYTIAGEKQTGFSWTAGVGVEVPITSSIGMFIQARSVLVVLQQPRQYFPVSAGILLRRE